MADLPVLDPIEQRVLGALLEKQVTVPGSYPLSLNALQTACNQATSRDPVTAYTEQEVETTARALKDRGLLRIVWAGRGSRVLRFHQLLDEVLELAADERALLTALLLRGAQTAGELKARTDRLHTFTDKDAVTACLQRLAELVTPLVRELDRRPGQHDTRWIHLLGPAADDAAAPVAPAVDRDVVLNAGVAARDDRVRSTYDTVADAYADALGDELSHKPFDRWLLTEIAQDAGTMPMADVGCGPGQTTAFLAAAGARVTGFDLSPAMVERARLDHPDVPFEQADFTRLLRPPAAPAWGAITAWYAFVHLAGSELTAVLDGLGRVLAPDGTLAFCLHLGEEVLHRDAFFGQDVDVSFVLHDRDEVLAAVTAAGFGQVQWFIRSSDPQEAQTERLYVVARRRA